MTCLVCGRIEVKGQRPRATVLPNKATALLCVECAKDNMRVAEAERRIEATP